ncbi:MAG TPA: 2-C-methyl-D-erythritol 4-phosphate cytidylyltransferase [Solirubrobacteraceae bacterium]|jgi:2-C-methyl-D-erythritol 4-phosphate cytidylyltransferase|nr:2-C-methyl-D-erythritol 4-phosphate cytidylyltransferase [Solirubrobacteraceae bacterium]
MAVALIVAAGRGERLGSDRPKALVTIAGKPMVQWSVDALSAVDRVTAIVVALPAPFASAAPVGTIGVAGGAVRSESVRCALDAAGDGDPVIVHDAARPLADVELFERALEELRASGADAVIAATPVADTIKEVGPDGRTVTRTLDRSTLWAVQTPQVFRRDALERVLSDASQELLAGATDDAWLIERGGGSVRVVEAPASNLKITTVTDLHVAELLLSERGSG